MESFDIKVMESFDITAFTDIMCGLGTILGGFTLLFLLMCIIAWYIEVYRMERDRPVVTKILFIAFMVCLIATLLVFIVGMIMYGFIKVSKESKIQHFICSAI